MFTKELYMNKSANAKSLWSRSFLLIQGFDWMLGTLSVGWNMCYN